VTRFAVTRDLVLEACRALAELGAKRVVILTFHGGPLHALAIEAGVSWLAAHDVRAVAPLNAILRRMLMMDDPAELAPAVAHIADPEERAATLRDLPRDFHGGFFETSVALALTPGSVSQEIMRGLAPCPAITPDAVMSRAARVAGALRHPVLARELQLAAHGTGWLALDPFPGYTGRPHLATVEAGRFFVQLMVDQLAPLIHDVLEGRGRSPAPIMPWIERMSLGGRVLSR
jgi:creatinine amidohydrolase/Fe(II)-dependent formamide hydrolase-like protein